MDDSGDGKQNGTLDAPTKTILKKYTHVRRVKRTDYTSASSKGETHKQRFNIHQSSESSSNPESSDSEAENDVVPSSKKQGSNKSEESDSDNEPIKGKFGSAKDSQGSNSSDELFIKQDMVQNVVLSESEPEDEDAVKIHQAKLQARKNRLSSNVSSLSTANNRRPINKTLDLTGLLNKSKFIPARLSEVAPDLLGTSSSSDEEESNKVQFILKDSDEEAAPSSPSKRKSADRSLAASKGALSDTSDELSEEEKGPSPSKLSRTVEKPAEDDLEQAPLAGNQTATKSPVRKRSQSIRISTPQAKDLAPTRSLNKSKRKSKLAETQKSTNGHDESSLRPKSAKSPKVFALAASPKANAQKSPLKNGTPTSRAPTTPNRSFRRESPVFESDVLNEFNVAIESESLIPADDTATTRRSASGRKSIKRTPVRSARKSKRLQVKEANSTSSSKIDEALRSPKSKKETPRKTSKSPTKLPTALDTNLVSAGTNRITLNSPMQDVVGQRVVLGNPSDNPIGVRFMASSRPANDEDPIQYRLFYDSLTLFMIVWKLQPNTTNFSRTRGETCILVLEGEIKVDDEEHPRGQAVKLPGSYKYTVTNCGSVDALYQVTEYL